MWGRARGGRGRDQIGQESWAWPGESHLCGCTYICIHGLLHDDVGEWRWRETDRAWFPLMPQSVLPLSPFSYSSTSISLLLLFSSLQLLFAVHLICMPWRIGMCLLLLSSTNRSAGACKRKGGDEIVAMMLARLTQMTTRDAMPAIWCF